MGKVVVGCKDSRSLTDEIHLSGIVGLHLLLLYVIETLDQVVHNAHNRVHSVPIGLHSRVSEGLKQDRNQLMESPLVRVGAQE